MGSVSSVLRLLAVACVMALAPVDAVDTPAASKGPEATDFADLSRGAHFAFRDAGDRWTGIDATYRVDVARGAATITPAGGSPLGVETAAIARGAVRLDELPQSPRIDAEGALLVPRGRVVERFRNDADGVEQSWSFAERPEGDGPLTVRVRLSGQRCDVRSPSGLHCADERGRIDLRYGLATWVDARGVRTHVDARVEPDGLSIDVPSQLLDDSAYPAVLDPTIGPELAVDSPVLGPSGGNATAPRLAFDGTNYLAVWEDSRSGGLAEGVFAARISPAGTILDTVGIPIHARPVNVGEPSAPAVAFDGTNYLVAWSDARSGKNHIYGTRVSKAGVVLDGASNLVLTSTASFELTPALVFDGTNYLLTFVSGATAGGNPSELGANGAVRGERISKAGVVLDVGGFDIASGFAPAASCDATNCLVLYGQSTGISMRRVSKAGVVVDASDVSVPNATLNLVAPTNSWVNAGPGLAFDGAQYVVVWAQRSTVGGLTSGKLYGVLVDGTAAAVDMVKTPFAISTTGYMHLYGDVAFDGTNFRVVWGQFGPTANVFTARVSVAGSVLDGDVPMAPSGAQLMLPRVSCPSGSCVALWQDAYPYAGGGVPRAHVRGARVDAAGAVLDAVPFLVSSSANAERVPSVASSPSGSLVVWVDDRIATATGYNGLFAARLGAAGQSLAPSAIVVAPPADVPTAGRAATNGTDYLVVYATWDPPTDTYTLKYTRVSAAGVLLDTPAKVLDAQGVDPAVAYDGSNYFIVWHRHAGAGSKSIYGAHVTSAGTVVEAQPIEISSTTSTKSTPAIAASATDYLVVWGDDRLNAGHADLFAARVSHAGVVRDPFGFAVSTAANEQTKPAVASDGTSFLVTWSDTRNDPGVSNVYAARVDANGGVLDASGLAMGASLAAQRWSSVRYAAAAARYVITWEDARNASLDIYSAEVTPSGVVGAPASLVASTENEWGPETSSELLVYVREDSSGGYAPRVRARRWGSGADAGAADAGAADADTADAATIDGGGSGMEAGPGSTDGSVADAATPSAGHEDDSSCSIASTPRRSPSPCSLVAIFGLAALVGWRRRGTGERRS